MKIAIGNDHTAIELKNIIREYLVNRIILRKLIQT